MIRTAGLAATLALLATSAAACGGGDAAAEEVKDAARTFFKAIADGDGKRVCGLMRPDARREFAADVRELVLADTMTCEYALTVFAGGLTDDERRALGAASVQKVEFAGDRALIHDEDIETSALLAEHHENNGEPMAFAREQGRWLVAELG